MEFNRDFFPTYVEKAPMALAIERVYECEILSQKKFERPVLDIGCGDGIFAKILFSNKIDVGIDPNGVELERAKGEGAYQELIQCYGNKIPKADGEFKTIFSNSVFEHIEDIGSVLDECRRILSNDGRMYLTLPTEKFERNAFVSQILRGLGLKSLAGKFQKFYNNFWRHYHAYTVPEWSRLFAKHGFEVHEFRLYNSPRSCMVNDVLAYVALPSFLSRKFLNRWFFLPRLRQLYSPGIANLFSSHVKKNQSLSDINSGLVFFELRKRNCVA